MFHVQICNSLWDIPLTSLWHQDGQRQIYIPPPLAEDNKYDVKRPTWIWKPCSRYIIQGIKQATKLVGIAHSSHYAIPLPMLLPSTFCIYKEYLVADMSNTMLANLMTDIMEVLVNMA